MEVVASHTVGATRILAVQGDITRLEVDAIVNAANEMLVHGGGVAAAISRAGAPVVQAESLAWVDEHGPVGAGMAAVTGTGSMPARLVIHVVGPRYRPDRDSASELRVAVRAALAAAEAHGAARVALPAISAGIFGYPPAAATAVIAAAAAEWAETHPLPSEIVLVGFDQTGAGHFAAAVEAIAR